MICAGNKSNEKVFGGRQWFTDWEIKVYDENKNLIHTDILNLNGKTVFIKFLLKKILKNLFFLDY